MVVTATEGQQFRFRTQGSIERLWDYWTENIWNRKLINLDSPSKNGVYKYITTTAITENTVNSTMFSIGFRCDNWSSGSFRVRNVRAK